MLSTNTAADEPEPVLENEDGSSMEQAPLPPKQLRAWSHLLSLGTRQRVFFTYEKRIRDKSSLDKVFDYFSSQEHDGIKSMSPRDLLQAVVPTYPASKSTDIRAGYLEGERQDPAYSQEAPGKHNEFFKQFDIDGDGLVSYMEFLLVLTLISIPKLDVHIIFDVVDADSSGEVDAAEFDVIMKMLQDKAKVHYSKYHIGRHTKLLGNAPATGLLASFFGPDQTGKLKLSEFARFLDMLHDQLVLLEFEHYLPDEQGCIPGIDFARSLVTAAEIFKVEDLLNKVDSLAEMLVNLDISYPEFVSVHQLQVNLDPIVVALEFMEQVGRPVTKEEFRKTVMKLTGIALSDQVVDVIMAVFDNGNGSLNVPLFLETMKRRGYFWARRGNGGEILPKNRVQRLFSCIQACNSNSNLEQ